MKTNKQFRDFKADIVKCISESTRIKKNKSTYVHEEDIKDKKILYRGTGSKGKEDALWFYDKSFMNFQIIIKISDQDIDVIKYSIRWESEDERNVFLIRYEWNNAHPQNEPNSIDTKKEYHPNGHLHINRYKDLRLPTEKIDFGDIFKCIENWIEKRRKIDKSETSPVN